MHDFRLIMWCEMTSSWCHSLYLSGVYMPYCKRKWRHLTGSSSCLFILVNEVVCCYCPRNTMFTELSLGCWSSRHKNVSTYQVSSPTVVFFVSYMHVHAPFIMYCSRWFVAVFQEINCLLNMTLFVRSQSFISLPSFTFVSAAVSELHESNQNKKKEKEKRILNWQFNTFGYIIF